MNKFDDMYYEIEYDSCPIPGVGKFVPRPQKIGVPERDEIRELFAQMRDLARAPRSAYHFYGNEELFYKQGMFMKDFSDDYPERAEFFAYFPTYQMMGYRQLRTYFTWRTEVRRGNVCDVSLSYAFVYIYELLNNIGVDSPADGFNQLLSFWMAFRNYNPTLDRYVPQWLKEYHAYYDLPSKFEEFAIANHLQAYYPEDFLCDSTDLDAWNAISSYDIKKSKFYADDKESLVRDCFASVICKLKEEIPFRELVFTPVNYSRYNPFGSGAPVFDCLKKMGVRTEKLYIGESGRRLVGYIMKKMESCLRRHVKHKHSIDAQSTAFLSSFPKGIHEAERLIATLDREITQGVAAYYADLTRTVVKVDHSNLARIRTEALGIQAKLVVQEEVQEVRVAIAPISAPPEPVISHTQDVWTSLKHILTGTERDALSIALHEEMELKAFADEQGMMLEVLVDGINEKAMDTIGDSLLDEDFVLYNDYREQVKELIE